MVKVVNNFLSHARPAFEKDSEIYYYLHYILLMLKSSTKSSHLKLKEQ